MNIIKDEDIEDLKKLESEGKNPFLEAVKMGYDVDRDLVLELILNDLGIQMQKRTNTKFYFQPEESGPEGHKAVKDKFKKLYGDLDRYSLYSIASNYPNYKKKSFKLHDSYIPKEVQVKHFEKMIIRGIGLHKCVSIQEIEDFKLSEKDEEIRRNAIEDTNKSSY